MQYLKHCLWYSSPFQVVKVDLADSGESLTVQFDGHFDSVRVSITGESKIQGLCGNKNGKVDDDFVTRNQVSATWNTNRPTTTPTPTEKGKKNKYVMQYVMQFCDAVLWDHKTNEEVYGWNSSAA